MCITNGRDYLPLGWGYHQLIISGLINPLVVVHRKSMPTGKGWWRGLTLQYLYLSTLGIFNGNFSQQSVPIEAQRQ